MEREKQRAGKGADRRFEAERERWVYLIGGLVLVILLIAAFVTPKLIFTVQDMVRNEHMVLTAQEKSDISAFSTSYEKSLYRRLAKYAEGVAEGRTYYAASQDLEDTADLEAFLTSAQTGLRQDGILLLEDLGWVPDFLSGGLSFEVKECKQYVIYGDDFAEGVNFILRYAELEWEDGDSPHSMKLLLDGESGAVYGLRWESAVVDHYRFDSQGISLAEDMGIDEWYTWSLLCTFAVTIGGYGDLLNLEDVAYAMEGRYTYEENVSISETTAEEVREKFIQELSQWMTEEQVQYVRNLMVRADWRTENEGNRLVFEIPYGEGVLPYVIESEHGAFGDSFYWHVGKRRVRCRDMTVGFPDVYRMVPEFNRE